MQKRTAATVGGVVAAMLLVAGIAWASGSDDSPTSTTTPSTSTSVDDTGSSTSVDDNSSSTSPNGSTSTTIEDNTSSTVDDDDTTSSTIDDDDHDVNDDRGKDDDDQDDDNKGPGGDDDDDQDDDSKGPGGDDDDAVAVADGVHTYQVAGIGSVTINVTGGNLELANVQANTGWTTVVDEARSDRIMIKFRNGESEAEFEAELEHGAISIDIEQGD